MRTRSIVVLGLAAAAALPLLAQEPTDIALLMSSNACENCNCYWSSDCSDGQSCNYNGCTHVGKLDGVCKSSGGAGGLDLPDLPIAAEGVREYFAAFHVAAQDITGATLPEARTALRAAHGRRLTLEGHLSLRMLVLDALDVTIGWDLVTPTVRFCSAAGPAPTFRGHLDAGTRALLAATEEALTVAIANNDASRVREPIEKFWASYPDYEPDHSGRCYDHGHDDYPYKSPAECQITELSRMLATHLPPRG